MSVTFLFCFIFFSFLCFAPLLSSEAYEKWILKVDSKILLHLDVHDQHLPLDVHYQLQQPRDLGRLDIHNLVELLNLCRLSHHSLLKNTVVLRDLMDIQAHGGHGHLVVHQNPILFRIGIDAARVIGAHNGVVNRPSNLRVVQVLHVHKCLLVGATERLCRLPLPRSDGDKRREIHARNYSNVNVIKRVNDILLFITLGNPGNV